MTCTTIPTITSFSDFMVYPTECNYWFWLIILGVLFVVVAWGIFKTEEKRKGEGEIVSAMGVSSIAITTIATIGTLIKNASNVPMIQTDVLLYIIAVTVVIVLIWIFKD